MYLWSRRATISVKARAPSRSVPPPPRGFRAPLPREWRSLTRSKTPKRRILLCRRTWKSGRTDTRKPRGSTRRTSSSPRKVCTIQFSSSSLVVAKSLLLPTFLRSAVFAHARTILGRLVCKWNREWKSLVSYLSDYEDNLLLMAIIYSWNLPYPVSGIGG